MPLASMRSNNLGGSAAGPPKSLFLSGLDVLKQPGTGTNRFGVPLETCDLTEEGPGGVSELTFTLEDPGLAAPTLAQGQDVRFHDHLRDKPIFLGFVQSWSIRVLGIGRAFDVTCVGIENVLDWMLVPSLTLANGSDFVASIQSVMANATGIGVSLNVTSGGGVDGTQAQPVGNLFVFNSLNETVTLTGDTVREAIRKIAAVSPVADPFAIPYGQTYGLCSVDFWGGLRVWRASTKPGGYADLTINDAPAGPILGADLSHNVAAIVPHQVYVQGGNAAGTGLVSDGSGIPGPVATFSDSSILAASTRDALGKAYLTDQITTERGSYTVETFVPSTDIHAGSRTTITDAQIGLSGNIFPIAAIRKTFQGANLETWAITYGGLPPSLTRMLRRLTRDIRS